VVGAFFGWKIRFAWQVSGQFRAGVRFFSLCAPRYSLLALTGLCESRVGVSGLGCRRAALTTAACLPAALRREREKLRAVPNSEKKAVQRRPAAAAGTLIIGDMYATHPARRFPPFGSIERAASGWHRGRVLSEPRLWTGTGRRRRLSAMPTRC
jgi:hypothetical protein